VAALGIHCCFNFLGALLGIITDNFTLFPGQEDVWGISLLSTTNKMQRYTIFFIIVNALHVSGGFSAHHQALKNCTHSIWYVSGLLAAYR
jgi:hypothetical protein